MKQSRSGVASLFYIHKIELFFCISEIIALKPCSCFLAWDFSLKDCEARLFLSIYTSYSFL